MFALWLFATVLLSGCQNDSGEEGDDKAMATIYLGTSVRTSVQHDTRGMAEGYSAYVKGISSPGIIKLFFSPADGNSGSSKIVTPFFNWQHDCDWMGTAIVSAQTYYVYGYMPQEAATATITSADYPAGATLTLSGLNTVSAQDVCVVVGVAKEATPDGFDITNTSVVVTPGSFSYEVTEGDNYMYVLMEHIYAEVALNFSVHTDYAKLRTIKVKRVVMTTEKGTTQAIIKNESPYSTISFEPFSTSEADIDLLEDNAEVQIAVSPEVTEIPVFFTPLKSGEPRTVILTTVYDVYDRYGHLIRENCQAKNSWTLDVSLESGQKITINALIQPTYLYQLGSYDLDNPTIELTAD